jgi:uncharacterized protein (TIGR01777 family)
VSSHYAQRAARGTGEGAAARSGVETPGQKMKIVIAGGSGFLGTALSSHLIGNGHEVVILTRKSSPAVQDSRENHPAMVSWTPDGQLGPWAKALTGAAAVVNLAGESIAARRWSPAQKDRLRQSRLVATRSLTAAIRAARITPPVLISASAVGYYGDRGEETLTEASAPGTDFLAKLCVEWEAAAAEAAAVTRVALVRTGIVLDRRDGALAKMLLPFRLFAGGPLGSGRQFMPWIHREDWIRLVAWMIQHEGARGPVNATAPSPVTNAEFSKALGQALHRPSFMPAPALALRIALGEMADALLLSGQRALPVRASDLGFSFKFTTVDAALADVLK